MTPEAVVYRYLDLVTPGDFDLESLLGLVMSDADLLGRWLGILDIPVDINLLGSKFRQLTPEELKSVSQAQIWAASPSATSARLSLEQWLSVLRSAICAEIIHNHFVPDITLAERHNLRMRALLALSGVHLDGDPMLVELNEFRGTRPDLLEDASLELRVFRVVDAIEVGQDVPLATQLLGISADVYQGLVAQVSQHVAAQVSEIGLSLDADVDWGYRIWLQQQISVAASAFKGCKTILDLAEMHLQVSRSVFTKAPLMMIQSEDLTTFEYYPDAHIKIARTNKSSAIAQAAAQGTPIAIEDQQELAVVDRQLLRILDSEAALVAATQSEPAVVFVVDGSDAANVELATGIYVNTFSKCMPLKHNTAQSTSDNDRLSVFRLRETKRLRELVHEANNPLSIVYNYLHILELKLGEDPEIVEQLQLISDELRRAAGIFAQVNDIPKEGVASEPTIAGVAEFDVVAWLQDLATLQTGFMQSQDLAFQFSSTIDHQLIRTDKQMLTQILVNLLKNAAEATEAGGKVTLSLLDSVYRNEVRGLEIVVSDTGKGIPQSVLQSLTEAKTTQKGGDHQGIGLQLVYRLAREVEVEIDLRTGPTGSSFRLFLEDESIS